MGFLIEQFWLCLLLAFLLGALLGWLLRHWRCQAQTEALERELRELRERGDNPGAPVLSVAAPIHREAEVESAADPELDRDSYPIEEVEGIGAGFGRALRELGIATTLQMVDQAAGPEQRRELAEKLGREQVDEDVVTSWVSMCDLMRLPGIRGQFAELLEFTSVNSVQELAEQEPEPLLRRLTEVNRREHRVPELPERASVESWIAAARGATPRLRFADARVAAEASAALDDYDIEEVEGIGSGYGRALRQIGIATTRQLLAAGLDEGARRDLAERLELRNVDASVVTSWVAMCDLMRVPGVTGQYAELLYFGGVRTAGELAAWTPNDLLDRMARTEEEQNRVPDLPRIDRVAEWVEAAKTTAVRLRL